MLEYWNKFSVLLFKPFIQPESDTAIFEKGLKFEIKNRLVDKDMPKNLDEYVVKVIELGKRYLITSALIDSGDMGVVGFIDGMWAKYHGLVLRL